MAELGGVRLACLLSRQTGSFPGPQCAVQFKGHLAHVTWEGLEIIIIARTASYYISGIIDHVSALQNSFIYLIDLILIFLTYSTYLINRSE